MITASWNDIIPAHQELIVAAEKARENAYCPYSRFQVGAALRSAKGNIYAAANFENASYGLTLCAERASIAHAMASGARRFLAIAIVGQGPKSERTAPTAPCGACRQVLKEVADISGRNLEIVLATADRSEIILTSVEELLPLAFGPKSLGVEVQRRI